MISIVIPAYNERKRLPITLERITQYLSNKKWDYEIIVVDDGSTDGTAEIAKNAPSVRILINPINKGKGYSVRQGILASKGDLVLFTDADLSTPIEEIEKLMPYINSGYDIAIGSRSIKGARIMLHQPILREFMGKFFNKVVRLITVRGFIDTQCGFKLFTKDAAHKVFSIQRLNGFSFDVEALFIARKMGYKIKEVPITWYNSPHSKVRLLHDPISMFTDLIKIRFRQSLVHRAGGHEVGLYRNE